MMRWISDLAPTSTPCVGSSRIRTEGLVASQRADDDFLLIAAGELVRRRIDVGALTARRSLTRGQVALPGEVEEACAGDGPQTSQRDVGGDGHFHDQPVMPPILGNVGDAQADWLARIAMRTGWPRSRVSRLVVGRNPKSVSASSVRPAPTSPASADNFAGAHRQVDRDRATSSSTSPSATSRLGNTAESRVPPSSAINSAGADALPCRGSR